MRSDQNPYLGSPTRHTLFRCLWDPCIESKRVALTCRVALGICGVCVGGKTWMLISGPLYLPVWLRSG